MSDVKYERVLLLGGRGLLGRSVAGRLGELEREGELTFTSPDRESADITDKGAIARTVSEAAPDLIINCAAQANVEGAEEDPIHAFMVNAVAVENLASLAREHSAALLHLSTDYVFDGEKGSAYSEEDLPDPRCVYGASKHAGEMAILGAELETAWIVRTSWLHGPGGGHFPALVTRLARAQKEITIVDDQRGAPTSAALVADAILEIAGLTGGGGIEPGLLHVAGRGECSWYDLARRVVDELEARGEPLVLEQVTAVSTEEYAERCRAAGKEPPAAPRPPCSTLDCSRYERLSGKSLPTWEDALAREMAGDLDLYLGENTLSETDVEPGPSGETREAEPT